MDGGTLPDMLQGRTTYAMSGEVPVTKRIPAPKLQPADVLFFGAKGPKSKPAQIDHTGIYLGNGWFIHSSRYGVAVAPLSGWYGERLAWGRRPIAEAGLVFPPVRTAISPKSPYGGIHRFEQKGRIWRSGVFVWGGCCPDVAVEAEADCSHGDPGARRGSLGSVHLGLLRTIHLVLSLT